MFKKAGIIIICISVIVLVLGSTGNSFTYDTLKDSVESVSASSDMLSFDFAYLQTFAYSFRGFFSGGTSQFGIGDFSGSLFDNERNSYYFYVFTSPPEDQYGPWAERVYLGTDDYSLAERRYDRITETFRPMENVAQNFDLAIPKQTGSGFFDAVIDGINFICNFIQALFFIIAAIYSAVIVIVQVLLDVSGLVFALCGALLRLIGIA